MKLNVGDIFDGGNNQKITVVKVDNEKKVILFIFEGSGEPFVVTNDYWIENGYMQWHGSRYRSDIESAIETFRELVSKSN